ncbi:hypothetical protein MKW92_029346 [Papaver armeniacum]|nr:hypothetical protein MKW92_029346 [Papaver armeniacum]
MRLNANGKIQRNKHARKNWRAKVKRRKLEKQGLMATNIIGGVQEIEEGPGQMAENGNGVDGELGEGPDQMAANVNDVDGELGEGPVQMAANFSSLKCSSTVKFRREKVPYSTEEEEKLKSLMRKLRKFTKNKKKRGIWSKMVKLGKGVFKACRTGEDLRLKWRSMKAAGLVE